MEKSPSTQEPLQVVYKPLGALGLIYAVTVALFGLLAFFSKGSYISLLSGGGFGLILLFISYKILNGSSWALCLFPGINALLCATFFIRFLKTNAFYPSLLLFIISTLVFLLYFAKTLAYVIKSSKNK